MTDDQYRLMIEKEADDLVEEIREFVQTTHPTERRPYVPPDTDDDDDTTTVEE